MRSLGDPSVVPRSPRTWALIVVGCAMAGLLSFGIITTEIAASGGEVPWRYHLLLEMDGACVGLLLAPFLLWFMGRFPIRRDNWWRQIPRHLAASLVFGISATLLMWGSRIILFRLLGWGEYDYGLMRYRFPMEYQKQFVVYWAVYGVVALVSYTRRVQAEKLRASELEAKLSEARLEALKMQLNPHFLFNTLNMISSHVHDDPELADAMIGHLSDFLRVTLRHSGVQEVALEQELDFLGSYLAIMKARFEERLEVEMAISDAARQAVVPHLVLQPLVENSIAHSTRDHEGPARIRISAVIEADRTVLAVEDNGPGLEGEDQDALETGIGLGNTGERLRRLYGEDFSFELANREDGGLQVRIDLPYRRAPEQGGR